MMSMMGTAQGYQTHMARTPAPLQASLWAPDPYQHHGLRNFDGTNWTMTVSISVTVATDHLG